MISVNTYEQVESKHCNGHSRICINGRTTGSEKCVGYCKYAGHPGFLTDKLRREHDCLGKCCFHYVPKPPRNRPVRQEKPSRDNLLNFVKQKTSQLEGMRIINVFEQGLNRWQFNYITISNDYPIHDIEQALERDLNGKVSFVKLNYTFDRCVALILAE